MSREQRISRTSTKVLLFSSETSRNAGSIAEAQTWEYKLIEVQGWLSEKDTLLTSHLEQELTVDDLPDESQVRVCCKPRWISNPCLECEP